MKTLTRTKQCNLCPWKVSTNPHDIPDGYDVAKHQNLACTIAGEDGNLSKIGQGVLRMMACHHSFEGEEEPCIGYLNNQLGVGNNILLRIQMMHYTNASQIKTYGEQHQCFEDTLPKTSH